MAQSAKNLELQREELRKKIRELPEKSPVRQRLVLQVARLNLQIGMTKKAR